MKSLKMAAAAVLLAGLMAESAMANDNGIGGLIIGAGSGAVVGQAIGRDTEGTLIGTAVGGMLGYIVGNEMDKGYYGRPYPPPPQPVVYSPPPPPQAVVYVQPPPRPRPVVHVPPPRPWKHHGPPHDQVCRQVIERRDYHGRYREVVTTICRDRDDWRHHRRPHWRHDQYRSW